MSMENHVQYTSICRHFQRWRDHFRFSSVFSAFLCGVVSTFSWTPTEIRAASFVLKKSSGMQVQIGHVSYLDDFLLAEERTLLLFPSIKLITMQVLLTQRLDKAEVERLYSVEKGNNNPLRNQS